MLYIAIISILFNFLLIIKLYKQQIRLSNDIKKAREDSVNKSRAVMSGHIVETLAPLIPGFPYNGRDARQFGNPIDYVIFDGMSDFRDSGEGRVEQVILVDIKTGNSQLSPVERSIKEAVEEGRVRWETLRMDFDRGGLLPVKHRKKKVDNPPEVE